MSGLAPSPKELNHVQPPFGGDPAFAPARRLYTRRALSDYVVSRFLAAIKTLEGVR